MKSSTLGIEPKTLSSFTQQPITKNSAGEYDLNAKKMLPDGTQLKGYLYSLYQIKK
jgi:hypothetical protein